MSLLCVQFVYVCVLTSVCICAMYMCACVCVHSVDFSRAVCFM